MNVGLRPTGIRARLLVAYVGILVAGFAALTLLAGNQITASAELDYTQRLQNEIGLIAQGITNLIEQYVGGEVDANALAAAIQNYESQVNGSLQLYNVQDLSGPMSRLRFRDLFELETAQREQIVVVKRLDDAGEERFFTAAPVSYNRRMRALLQLSVPASNLQSVLLERWIGLGAVFALVTGLALLAVLGLARSIIRPLYQLRDGARHLSEGEFSYRVTPVGQDEISEVARAFNHMAQQVESMLEEQRAFASNTSHELRTPLTTIRLRTEALRYDTALDDGTTSRYIAEIDDEAARLGQLVQDLTLLSRFDAGRAELGREQVDMNRFAASIHQRMLPQAQSKSLQMALELPAESATLYASLNHLTIAFRNLLDNAIKYTPGGGTITWQITNADSVIHHVIRDTGRGITAEHLPRLFERFYRADRARSRDLPGTGLGLALVKSIVEAYGGQIAIESEGADRGTTVRVDWPIRPENRRNGAPSGGESD